MADETLRAAWQAVLALGQRDGAAAIRPLFAADPHRARAFTRRAGGVLLDMSRTAIGAEALAALLALARAAGVEGFRDAMARGEAVNNTEGRAALHMALRAPRGVPFQAGAEDAAAAVQGTLDAMRAFCAAVHEGKVVGAARERFTDVLNIGIGGSDLGPAMAARALWTPRSPMRASATPPPGRSRSRTSTPATPSIRRWALPPAAAMPPATPARSSSCAPASCARWA